MNGLISIQSEFDPTETVKRLEAEIKRHGMTVFARMDHAALANEAGLPLLPTVLIIFGNPKVGTPLMQANQSIGLDLPLKFLVWQNAAGRTWLAYNDPEWLADRHGIAADLNQITADMADALTAMARKVISIR
jgi:uncharacterized protein (DUF302 family)